MGMKDPITSTQSSTKMSLEIMKDPIENRKVR